jgi:tetratricopeptide (TPR) repeat protein
VTKEERYEQIERYLADEMAPGERADFTMMLTTDAALKEEVALHEGVQTLSRREAFLQNLSAAAKDHFAVDSAQTGSGRRLLYWSIAAAVVLLAAVGIFVLQQPARSSSHELYTAYFTPYEVPTALRSEGSLYADADARQAFSLYSQKDYAGAIPFFSKALEHAPGGNSLLVLSRGICYLAAGDTRRAEQDFQEVIGDSNSLFTDQAQWYLALTYLRAGDTDAARAGLRTITDARAKALLRDME